MIKKKTIGILALFGTLIILAWSLAFPLAQGLCAAEQNPPAQNKGVTVTLLSTVDLATEIPGMQGRQLRLRMVTLEPGGALAVHGHKDHPGVAYLLKGTVIEHIGDVANEYNAGDHWSEAYKIHWIENRGSSPAVFICTDVFKQN